jgi:hypothetical protein
VQAQPIEKHGHRITRKHSERKGQYVLPKFCNEKRRAIKEAFEIASFIASIVRLKPPNG